MTTIVPEEPEHLDAIRDLTVRAFTASSLGHQGEADLIAEIRDQCDDIVSLVAIDGGMVVGHILFSPAVIQSDSGNVGGMGLGPMSVSPSHQNRGIGSSLVQEGLRAMVASSECAFTIVAGHVGFYPRFGFEPAQQYSITHGFEGMPQDILFIQIHDKTLMGKLSGSRAFYDPAFGPQHVVD